MKKILFLIHDLGPGGAEKVLVNLVNHMDPEQFDITVMTLFDVGVNRQFLAKHIRYRYCFKHMFRGNSHVMKLPSPGFLHKWFIKEKYDIEVSYLEGPCARVISGCPHKDTKLVAWIHCLPQKNGNVTLGFRSYEEAAACYGKFHRVICVSRTAEDAFRQVFPKINRTGVVYNTNDSHRILSLAAEPVDDIFPENRIKLIGVGKLVPVKAFDRLVRIHAKLRKEGYPVLTYILGVGALQNELERLVEELDAGDSFRFLGYQTNPYRFVSRCDLFVCSSLSEGFSTAATEALIVGTPVCTVEVSGMKEMLGSSNEYGVVTENSEDALYLAIKQLLDDPAQLSHYKKMAAIRGKDFRTEETVRAAEQMLEDDYENQAAH